MGWRCGWMRAAPAGPSWVGKSPRSVLLPGCAGNPGPAPACGSYPGRSGETSPTQQKSHGALCSMALIGLGIYGVAMRAAPAGPSWAGKSPRSVLLPGCAGNPSPCPPAGHFQGAPVKSPPPNKKAMGLSCSMALIDFRIYSMAMRVDAGSSCCAFLGTVMLRTPDSYLHLISSGRRSPT